MPSGPASYIFIFHPLASPREARVSQRGYHHVGGPYMAQTIHGIVSGARFSSSTV